MPLKWCRCAECGSAGELLTVEDHRRHARRRSKPENPMNRENPPILTTARVEERFGSMSFPSPTGALAYENVGLSPEVYRPVMQMAHAICKAPIEASARMKPVGEPSNSSTGTRTYEMAKFLENPLLHCHPLIVKGVFLEVILRLFENVSRDSCTVVLDYMNDFVGDAVALKNKGQPLSELDKRILSNFPRDPRTVEKALSLDPVVKIYAVCPACSGVLEPGNQAGLDFPIFPRNCSQYLFPSGGRCDALLSKQRVENGKSIRTPKKPYLVQSLDSFIGRLISRPKILSLLIEGMEVCYQRESVSDIKHGSVLPNLKAADGQMFMSSASGELRLAWSLSIDWFNPYHNKAAGKSASCGAIMLACLNLPIYLRHKPENMFLAGIIPGPKEPPGDSINNFLRPVIDVFLDSYEHGTRFTRTPLHPNGIVSRSIIALLIGDQPASRKIAGFASHTHRIHCTRHIGHTKEAINAISRNNWVPSDTASQLIVAEKWRSATTMKDRKNIFKRHGIRWSELHRLPYWDHNEHVIVDGMHNLFLGLVQYHARCVIGLEEENRSVGRRRNRTNIDSAQQSNLETSNTDDALFWIGEEYFDRTDGLSTKILSKHDIGAVREGISKTKRPPWSSGPPKNLGEPGHGKLKADQWKSAIEFEIPVSLVLLSAKSPQNSALEALARSTTLLAAAISGVTTIREVTRQTVDDYCKHMIGYLASLRQLQPDVSLRPNHHMALHFPDFLLRYGPPSGWWMFPYERLIGQLQRLHTNQKIGELEQTMLRSFGKMCSVRAVLESPGCPPILQGCAGILDRRLNRGRKIFNAHNSPLESTMQASHTPNSKVKPMEKIDKETLNALEKAKANIAQHIENWVTPSRMIRHHRVSMWNTEFTDDRTIGGHPVIFFKPTNSEGLVPGKIKTIISVPICSQGVTSEHVFMIVQRYLPLVKIPDPFLAFPNFGVNAWTTSLEEEYDVVPTWSYTQHAVFRKWEDTLVLKPIYS